MKSPVDQTRSTRHQGQDSPAGRGASDPRCRVNGKFLFAGEEKLYLRGVAYGPFRPESDGSEYHSLEQVQRDFAQMRKHGINALRTYTVPPQWLLDQAAEHGLRVLIGLA